MFNLKSHNTTDESDILRYELEKCDIIPTKQGYWVEIGDETLDFSSLQDAKKHILRGIEEIREQLWESWKDLAQLSIRISDEPGHNSGSLNNILFLNASKKSFSLSLLFTDLDFAHDQLLALLDTDIKTVDNYLVKQFNLEYFKIRSMHRLIMSEMYRCMLIDRYLTKCAQISGPWANLDLPIKERVWDWNEGEDSYFKDRQDSRRNQIRYNPENATSSGFYFVWNDLTRDPYKFTDMKEQSPYKSRRQLLIP